MWPHSAVTSGLEKNISAELEGEGPAAGGTGERWKEMPGGREVLWTSCLLFCASVSSL